MYQIALVTLTCMALVGCATSADYERYLSTFAGRSEIELVRAWGPPQQVYEVGGSRFLKFENASNLYVPEVPPTYTTRMHGNTAHTIVSGGIPADNIALSCTTTFELVAGVVKSWQWQGNNCSAR